MDVVAKRLFLEGAGIRELSQRAMEFAQSCGRESGRIGKEKLQEFLSRLMKKSRLNWELTTLSTYRCVL